MTYRERQWNPIIDYEYFSNGDHRTCMIVMVFPTGSLRDIMGIARRNILINCWNKKKHKRSTVVSNSLYYARRSREMSIEDRAKYSIMRKSNADILNLMDEIRSRLPHKQLLKNIEVKVLFDSTWYHVKSPLMTFLRWTGLLSYVRRFVYDVLVYHGFEVELNSIHILETQYTLDNWYWSSMEGNVLANILSKWGYFREKEDSKHSSASSY